MTNAYKTAVNEYMIQRGFEDADGNVLKPFHDRVIRPGDPDFGQGTEDQVMRNADAAFAGVADEDMTVALILRLPIRSPARLPQNVTA